MATIPARERAKILAIAKEVRKHVDLHSGRYCLPTGLCGEASIALSARLTRAGIPHEIWLGMWKGPIDIMGEALDDEFGRKGDHRNHTWIEFPRYEGMVLDVTADQFSKLPHIWFPADSKFYHGMEKFNMQDVLEEAQRLGIVPEERTLVPLKGPLFRRPVRTMKVHVREHLKHPPRSCLCHRSKTVNRVRKNLIRRLT